MSDIAEMISRISSMKNSEDSGGSGGGGKAEGFHPSDGSGGSITNLEVISSGGGCFGMDDKFNSLENVLSPSKSLDDLFKISDAASPFSTNIFEAFDKFAPVAIKAQLAAMPQKDFFRGSLQPPHIAVGGLKTAFGKGGDGEGQGH